MSRDCPTSGSSFCPRVCALKPTERLPWLSTCWRSRFEGAKPKERPQGPVQRAQSPHGTPRGRESIAATALQLLQSPFQCLYHTQPPAKTQQQASSQQHTLGGPNPPFLNPRTSFYQGRFPNTNHVSRENTPELLRCATEQQKLNDLSRTEDPGGAAASAQPFPTTTGAGCPAAQPRHHRMPRFTHSAWLRMAKRLPEAQRTHCRMNGTIDRARTADQV